jgi:hypothetical protein
MKIMSLSPTYIAATQIAEMFREIERQKMLAGKLEPETETRHR